MKKQKIDWSMVEEFHGFKVTIVGVRTPKQSTKAKNAEQKTSTNGGSYNDSPQEALLDADVVQPNSFSGPELSDLHVKISPTLHWKSTEPFKSFASKLYPCDD
jgi:hypothetical protein